MPTHKLWLRTHTKDGHTAEIYRRRNALLVFANWYYVHILAKAPVGTRRAILYGWGDADIEKMRKEVRAWTTDQMFKENPYLLEEARKFLPRTASP